MGELLYDLKYYNSYVWWVYSMISLLPLFVLSIYKLAYPIKIHKHNDEKPFPFKRPDKIARIFLFWGPLYYVIDLILAILIGNYDSCAVSFFLHHIISCIFLPAVIFQNYYPWFLCSTPFLHAILLAFPETTWLNYIYLFGCGLYQYGLYQEPFRKMKSYKFLQFGTWLLEITLVMIWIFGCKNNFE